MSLTLEQYEAAMKPLRRTSVERERLERLLADTDALLAEADALLGPTPPEQERVLDGVWDLRPDHWLNAEAARMRNRRRSMRRRRGHTYDRAGRPL